MVSWWGESERDHIVKNTLFPRKGKQGTAACVAKAWMVVQIDDGVSAFFCTTRRAREGRLASYGEKAPLWLQLLCKSIDQRRHLRSDIPGPCHHLRSKQRGSLIGTSGQSSTPTFDISLALTLLVAGRQDEPREGRRMLRRSVLSGGMPD